MSYDRDRDSSFLEDLINRAKRAGADAADAVMFDSTSLSVGQRLGKPETIERAESSEIGLRVFIGKQMAIVSTGERQGDAANRLVDQAVAMAKAVPEDPYAGIAEPNQLAKELPNIESVDTEEPSTESLIEAANEAEDAARAVEGITNSEGADAGYSRSRVSLAASNGFRGSYAVTRHSLAVSVLAGEGTKMERDYDYSSKVFRSDMPPPASIGKSAGERTIKRLNPRKIPTGTYPVIFDPRVSRTMLSHLIGAINGPAIARGASFLKDKKGERIFGERILIVDDPFVKRGLRSRPFDAEGIAPMRRNIVEAGVLTTWFLDLRSARQLELETTGHASRGASSPPSPSPSNLMLAAGPISPEDMIKETGTGLYVTELMGMGVNNITGDYSRGAAGFWIENGVLTYPVSEITIAGNLLDMFKSMTPADDLERKYGVDAPTVRIEGLTIAGS
ncbi:MAG: TldD/PmbA family protein [Alphaproteobacteria bacterium]|nr:TldD/PmbA family protein [Alphaproteobacteria bacterium SS10]